MLSILGLVFIFVATYYSYKSAKENGRNAIGWALACLGIGLGIQLVLPLIIGIILGVIWVSSGHSQAEIQSMIQTPAIIIGIVCLVLSVGGSALVMRQAAKMPQEKTIIKPPSPPEFN